VFGCPPRYPAKVTSWVRPAIQRQTREDPSTLSRRDKRLFWRRTCWVLSCQVVEVNEKDGTEFRVRRVPTPWPSVHQEEEQASFVFVFGRSLWPHGQRVDDMIKPGMRITCPTYDRLTPWQSDGSFPRQQQPTN
jgi:hypothetical protein